LAPIVWGWIKEFICDTKYYLFGCHGVGYEIYLEFYDFIPMLTLIHVWYPVIYVDLPNE
jgi:hypothetical protein